jgi:hypothetical protein
MYSRSHFSPIRSLSLAGLEIDRCWRLDGKGVIASAAAFDPELIATVFEC